MGERGEEEQWGKYGSIHTFILGSLPPVFFIFGSDKNTMDENDRQHSSEAQSIDDEGIRSNKRMSDDGSSLRIRAKRNRYVTVAWCGLNSGFSKILSSM